MKLKKLAIGLTVLAMTVSALMTPLSENLSIPLGEFFDKMSYTAEAETNQDYEYEVLEDSTVRITGYKGTDSYVEIPRTIDGYNVSTIGEYAFEGFWNNEMQQYDSYVHNIKIPYGITTIEFGAFSTCGDLEKITIPGTVETIGGFAFYGCRSLNEIELPYGVKSIGSYAFDACINLTSFTIPSTVSNIGTGAFGYVSAYGATDMTKIANFKVLCPPSTFAETYAINNEIDYTLTSVEKIDMEVGIGQRIEVPIVTDSFIGFPVNTFTTDTDLISVSCKSVTWVSGKIICTFDIVPLYEGSTTLWMVDNDGLALFALAINIGHSYSSEITTPATCITNGVITYTCECGDNYTENLPVAPTNHVHTAVTKSAASPTCIEGGLSEEITCLDCGKITKTQEVIKATGHKYTFEITTPVTCTTDGVRKYTCSVCGDFYSEAIKATGHTVVIDPAVSATCTTTGKTEGSHCSVCEEVITAQETIPLTDHTYTTKVVAPTYAAQGYTLHECLCGDSYKDTYTSKLTVPNVTGLKMTTNAPTSISMSWNKVTGATGYVVYQAIDGKWQRIKVTSGNTLTVSNLKSGTNYKFTVKAYKTVSGKNYYSPSYTGVWMTTIPTNVSGLKMTATKPNSISMSWNKITGATGYVVYQAIDGKWQRIKVTSGNTLTVSNLNAGTNYKFTVKAYKTFDSKNYYSPSYTGVWMTTLPAKPNAKMTINTSQAIRLEWGKVTGATGYVVYQQVNGSWVKKAVTKNNVFVSTGLASGTNYNFAVKAYKTFNGKNYYSPFATSTDTIKTCTKPATVYFTLTAGTNKATVSWNRVTGATGYIVYYKTSSTGDWQRLATTTSTSYTKTGLTGGKTYYFTVKAYKNFGGKTYYAEYNSKSVTVKTNTTPSVTTGTTGTKMEYTLNTNTMKFHYPNCSSARRISAANKAEYVGTREELIARGYTSCGRCNP